MKTKSALIIALIAAQHLLTAQSQPPSPPSLSAEDCKQITRRGDKFYVDWPVKFGPMTITKSTVGKDDIKVGGFTLFEAIEAACFNKST